MSELRQDIVSGDWVLLATDRAARPNFLGGKKKARKHSPKSTCPFEDLVAGGEWPPIIAYPYDAKKWKIAVVPNKYPAIEYGDKGARPEFFKRGIYQLRTAIGSHWLLLTRDHNRHFGELTAAEAGQVFEVFREAHEISAKEKGAAYVASFYNYGAGAGASVWHPHYQIITLPVVPAHAVHSMEVAREYFKEHQRCVRCDMIKTERRSRVRVVAENKHAIALAPYASKQPFEVNILPKHHWPSFRETAPEALHDAALVLQSVIQKMKGRIGDPDLNFFIHDTPLDHKDRRYHHWHIELIPRLKIDAGFEFSTGIGINVVDPDNAAAILRGEKNHEPTHL